MTTTTYIGLLIATALVCYAVGYVTGVASTDRLIRKWRRRQHMPYLPMCRVKRAREE